MTANWVFLINHTGSFVCFPVLGNRKVLPFSKQWERNEGYFSGTSWKLFFKNSSISKYPSCVKWESVCNDTEFYLLFTVDNQKNFVTEVSSPSVDTSRGKINFTKSLHKLQIIVRSLDHCSPIRLDHTSSSIRQEPCSWSQPGYPDLVAGMGRGRNLLVQRNHTSKDRSPWEKELCFALCAFTKLISDSEDQLKKSCHKAGTSSKPMHTQLSGLVTILGYWSMGQGKCSSSLLHPVESQFFFHANTSTDHVKFPVITVYTHFSYIRLCLVPKFLTTWN